VNFFALALNNVMSHNKIRSSSIVLAFGVVTALASVPRALSSQVATDPLGPIVAEALRNNLGIAQERLATERAAASVRESRSRFLPSLSIESRYSEQSGTLNLGDVVNPAYAALNEVIGENRFPTDLDITLPQTHESRLRLVQPVFDASIPAAYAVSRHTRDGQHFQQRVFARRLAAQAQTAYLNVATARNARRTWEATLDLVTESERVAGRLVEAGRATPDAVFRARADRSDVEQRLAEARDQEDTAARAFNQLLRRPLETPVDEVSDSLLRFEISLTEDEAIVGALARREELAQTAAGIRAAEAGVRLASASFLPNVALALDYGFQGPDLSFGRDEDFTVASVVLSWNLFSGGRDLARRQGAQADAERLRLRRAELEALVRLDVTQAYRAAAVARDAIATADAGLAAARRSFELVRRRYEEGLASQVEFLDARTSFTNAELNRVITAYRYAIRYVDLERAAALREID
jgi:outer membrane protein TolC